MRTPTTLFRRRGAFPAMVLLAALVAACSGGNDNPVSETASNVRGASVSEKQLAEAEDAPVLVGRAVLPAS